MQESESLMPAATRIVHRLAALLLATALPLAAQTDHAGATPSPKLEPVMMLSDIHLDPFHDPGKFDRLRKTPASGWAAILGSDPTATQAADFAKLQRTCKAKGVDTPYPLLASALAAAHQQQPEPLFVTVSGDLMAHQFDCRFYTLAPDATEAEYSAFAAKTVEFVTLKLRATFPGAPIYMALGNNDSGCRDYREDPYSAFLKADGQTFAAAALSTTNASAIRQEFSQFGDYNVELPAPFDRTRLVVLQDIFDSAKYAGCSEKKHGSGGSSTAGTEQMEWLAKQLAAARAAHEKVWVMAHIPPGVDAYSTLKDDEGNACSKEPPVNFIPSALFANDLEQYADVIKLVLLGHTHMDEMRAYSSMARGPAAASAAHDAVAPGKLVPSITPVNGNNPAFTVAEVNPATATLVDYTVYSASTPPDWDTAPTWSKEYQFSTTYRLPNFSGASAAKLTSDFIADRAGSSPESEAYQQFYFVGEAQALKGVKGSLKAAAMKLVWPIYACSLVHTDAQSFTACACPANAPQ
jgi:sphingomyelin phosphodiesterase acid-like 3